MGVPYYFYVIAQQHTGILLKECPSDIRRFYLDYNGGVHPVCHRMLARMATASAPTPSPTPAVAFETQLCEESWTYMLSLVREIQPTEVFIMLDGVAPIAKIQQQRKRRYLSILRQTMLRKFSAWDTNAISPGTAFMKQLNQYFRDKTKQTFSSIPIHFNGSDEPGEGEHKIFQQLKERQAEGDATVGSTVIYGLDADLIMLSLLSHRPRIYLMREHTNVKKHEEGFVYLDIDALRVGILKMLRKDYHWPVSDNLSPFEPTACNIIENYTIACFLLGNDFLPNITSLHLKKNGIYSILSTFKETWDIVGAPLVDRESTDEPISLDFLARWFERMAKSEDGWIAQMNEDYFKKRAFIQNDEDKVEFYPILPEHKSPLAFAIKTQPHQWRMLYYKHLMDSERQDRSVIIHACREYIHGILWTYSYYKQRPKPYDWYYPFGYAPTLLDISNQLSGDIPTYQATWAKWQQLSSAESERSIPMPLQLLAILPIESHGLLPETLQRRVRDPSYGIRYMYPTQYPIYTYTKQHLWECHPKLPILDFKALHASLS